MCRLYIRSLTAITLSYKKEKIQPGINQLSHHSFSCNLIIVRTEMATKCLKIQANQFFFHQSLQFNLSVIFFSSLLVF